MLTNTQARKVAVAIRNGIANAALDANEPNPNIFNSSPGAFLRLVAACRTITDMTDLGDLNDWVANTFTPNGLDNLVDNPVGFVFDRTSGNSEYSFTNSLLLPRVTPVVAGITFVCLTLALDLSDLDNPTVASHTQSSQSPVVNDASTVTVTADASLGSPFAILQIGYASQYIAAGGGGTAVSRNRYFSPFAFIANEV